MFGQSNGGRGGERGSRRRARGLRGRLGVRLGAACSRVSAAGRALHGGGCDGRAGEETHHSALLVDLVLKVLGAPEELDLVTGVLLLRCEGTQKQAFSGANAAGKHPSERGLQRNFF